MFPDESASRTPFLFTLHCPKLSYTTTTIYKGGWEMRPLIGSGTVFEQIEYNEGSVTEEKRELTSGDCRSLCHKPLKCSWENLRNLENIMKSWTSLHLYIILLFKASVWFFYTKSLRKNIRILKCVE